MRILSRAEAAHRIAKNIAKLLESKDSIRLVNLGIGIPSHVSDFIIKPDIYLHAENGLIGVGPFASEGEEDYDCVNAGRQFVSERPGSSYVDSSLSFGLIRGGHVDATVLGAFEVDEEANISNWIIPNSKQLGVGGAMDLVSGAKKVIVAMTHFDKSGNSKLVKKCSLPITGYGEADFIVTEYGIFNFENGRWLLVNKSNDISTEELSEHTGFAFEVAPECSEMHG